jgi:hypothetical protein
MIRRVLYSPAHVARFREALNAARAATVEARADLVTTKRELERVRGELTALARATLERQRAEADLELLKRDRDRHTRISQGAQYWLH